MIQQRGLELEISKGQKETMHFHPEVEVIFVIEGKLRAKIKDFKYELKKDDIILFNSNIKHSIECGDETIICCIKYSYQILTEIMQIENIVFVCNSVSDTQFSYNELRNIFQELVYQEVRQTRKTECLKESLLLKLLDYLIENYQIDSNVEALKLSDSDLRLQQIFQYVNKNFQYGVNLSELAEQMYVSTSTLSRFFKTQTGIYFADYVNQTKIRYAMQELLYTEKNIMQIAVDCGFSNASVFSKAFKDMYGLTPSDYREQWKAAALQKKKDTRAVKELVSKKIQEQVNHNKNADIIGKAVIKVDMSQETLYEKNWNKVINIGSLSNLLLVNLQYHTLYLAENLGLQYARIWNIFSRKLMLSDGKIIGNYNYDKIDMGLDFLVSHHIIPFIDLGKRPDVAMSTEKETVFFEYEYIDFHSQRAWEALLEDFINHVVRRYGSEEVSKWIFEVFIDYIDIHRQESHYYQEESYDPFCVYQYVYHIIKGILPDAKVGGPMGIIEWEYADVKKFFSLCKEQGCIPDFISFLLFPYEAQRGVEGSLYTRSNREQIEVEQVTVIRNLMKESGLENCKLYISEWNNSLSNRNLLNDSCFRAAYIVKKLLEIWDSVDMIGIWMGSDWVSSYYDTIGIANGGSGLLTKDGICKPAYYALFFMNKLGNHLIAKGENYIITRKSAYSYYIICFNFKKYSSNYFIREENLNSPDELEDIFENRDSMELNLVLEQMPPDINFVIKKRTVNESEGSILGEWKHFQYEKQMEGSDVKYIREACFPHMSMEKKQVRQGELHIKVTLKAHEVILLHVYENTR